MTKTAFEHVLACFEMRNGQLSVDIDCCNDTELDVGCNRKKESQKRGLFHRIIYEFYKKAYLIAVKTNEIREELKRHFTVNTLNTHSTYLLYSAKENLGSSETVVQCIQLYSKIFT